MPNKYIKYATACSQDRFVALMSPKNVGQIRELACYIYHALKLRETFSESIVITSSGEYISILCNILKCTLGLGPNWYRNKPLYHALKRRDTFLESIVMRSSGK